MSLVRTCNACMVHTCTVVFHQHSLPIWNDRLNFSGARSLQTSNILTIGLSYDYLKWSIRLENSSLAIVEWKCRFPIITWYSQNQFIKPLKSSSFWQRESKSEWSFSQNATCLLFKLDIDRGSISSIKKTSCHLGKAANVKKSLHLQWICVCKF